MIEEKRVQLTKLNILNIGGDYLHESVIYIYIYIKLISLFYKK